MSRQRCLSSSFPCPLLTTIPLPFSQAITKLTERSESGEAQSLFSVVNDLSKVFAKRVAEDQLLSFLYPLLEGLLDAQPDSADGCCVVINGIFRQRGPELANEVNALIEALHQKVSGCVCAGA